MNFCEKDVIRKSNTKKIILLTLVAISLLCILSISLYLSNKTVVYSFWKDFLKVLKEADSARRFILSFGIWAPLIFILLQSLQVIISPIPGEVTGLIGGFVFGVWKGFLFSTIGLTLGSLGAFFIARFFRSIVKKKLAASNLYQKFNHIVDHQGIFVSFILFLLPGFPKDFLCYLLGLSKMPWQVFLIVVLIGRMPGTLLLTLHGAKIYQEDFIGLAFIAGITLLLVLPAWYFRDAIYKWVERHELKD